MEREIFRACNLCEACCGIVVRTDGERILGIEGDPEDPFSQGYICPKAVALKDVHEDPDRLRRPIKREGSSWREISWEEALEEAARGLLAVRERYGADGIATYLGNPTVHNFGSVLYAPVLLRALGGRQRFSASSVDQLPKMLSSTLLFGRPLQIPVPDVDRTNYLLILGANPAVSNGSLMTAPAMPRRLKRIRDRGGRIVVIDPQRTETARVADEHFFIRPGTDALLLAAMVNALFAEDLVNPGRLEPFLNGREKLREAFRPFEPESVAAAVGIPADAIRRLAREFAGAASAACYGRIGTCVQEFGALASWLIDLVNILTGNLDRPGGAMFATPAARPSVGKPGPKPKLPYGRWRSRVRGLPEFNGELPVAALAEEIETPGEGQIHALVTMAGNPVLSTPNGAALAKALEKLDFMVSIDIYLNETTRHATVILPPTSALEHDNYALAFYALAVRNAAKYSPAVLEPPPDSRHDWQIILELAARLGGMAGADLRTLDDMVASYVIGNLNSEPAAPLYGIRTEEALAKLGGRQGPARLVDILLRAGPRGDKFGNSKTPVEKPLDLDAVARSVHGIDLGPLRESIPSCLATPSGKIELAPDLLMADLERLKKRLGQARENGILLVGRRDLRSNNSWMHNSLRLVKGPKRCLLRVNPQDASRLGIESGTMVEVKSSAGSLAVEALVTPDIMPGVVSLPHGWGHDLAGARLSIATCHPGVNSNLLADPLLVEPVSGNAVLNGIPVVLAAKPEARQPRTAGDGSAARGSQHID